MKQKSDIKEGKKRARMTFRQRWRRGADGKLHYAGACPFNHLVCRTMNAFAGRKHSSQGA
jgi:hypothetical protein